MSYQEVIEESDIIDGLSVKYLKFFGFWKIINDYRTTGNRNNVIKANVLVSFSLAAPYFLFQCISYFSVKVDLQKSTFLLLHTLPGIQMCFRVLVFWFGIDKQCRLYNLLRKDFIYISDEKRLRLKKIYRKISKSSNMCCTVSMIVNISIMGIFLLNPDISVDYILYHTGDIEAVTTGRKKILSGWYPFPMNDSPYFEIIFVYEAVYVAWTSIHLSVYFCLFFEVLVSLYAQFTVLRLQIATLNVDYKNWSGQNYDTRISRELNKILREHQKLLRYTDEMKIVYNPIVTMTLGIAILICVINAMEIFLGMSISPMFIFQGCEVTMFCLGSSFLEIASSDLQFAIYSIDWYKSDVKFRRDALMMMIRARKGETFKSIAMYPVNRETLMTFMQFTYTTSTVLSRLTG